MNWPLVPLRRMVECLDGRRIPLNREQRGEMQGEVPYWGAGGVLDHVDRHLFDESLVLLGEDGAPFFEPGKDVAYSVDGPVWINNHIHVLRPINADPRFLAYALNSVDYANYITGSTREKLTQDDMREIVIACPGLEEQRRIADFLYVETRSIDALQQSRERQRELLVERELSVIYSQMVGVDEKVERKSTGWRWLPTMPSHWRLAPVYSVYDVRLGKMLSSDRATKGTLHPYLRNANVSWYSIDTQDLAMMDFSPDEYTRYSVKNGDLLVCEGGAGVAEAAVWDRSDMEIFYQKSLHRVRGRSHFPVEWLMYWLRIAKSSGLFASEGNIATIPHLTGEQLRGYRIPVPSDVSQRILRIETHSRIVGELTQRLNDATTLARERQQALITAAVTGQMDVTTASPGVSV